MPSDAVTIIRQGTTLQHAIAGLAVHRKQAAVAVAHGKVTVNGIVETDLNRRLTKADLLDNTCKIVVATEHPTLGTWPVCIDLRIIE